MCGSCPLKKRRKFWEHGGFARFDVPGLFQELRALAMNIKQRIPVAGT